jgi:hypothetical protein
VASAGAGASAATDEVLGAPGTGAKEVLSEADVGAELSAVGAMGLPSPPTAVGAGDEVGVGANVTQGMLGRVGCKPDASSKSDAGSKLLG